jgi:nucleoside-diphosphate-sugar epimerase
VKVLLTGASGFLGRHVLGLLRQRGVSAWTLGRSCPVGQHARAHVYCDLLVDGGLGETLRHLAPSHLLHLAWVTDPATYQASPRNGDWVRSTKRLARAFCDAGGSHIVVAGSCAEYDWSHGWCQEEETPLRPATPYGEAKNTTRQDLLALCSERGVRLAWARIFFPFGPAQAPGRLIPSLLAVLMGAHEPFSVQTGQRRDFVAAADVAHALLTLLEVPAHGSFNISSGHPRAIGEVVQLLAQLIGANPQPLLAVAATQLQPPELVAGDNSRLRALGWNGPTPIADSLAQMVALARREVPHCQEQNNVGC